MCYYIDFYTNRNKTEIKKQIFNNINDVLNFCLNEKYINVLIDYNKQKNNIIHDKKNILKYLNQEQEAQAREFVKQYYNYKMDLESLHNKLYKLFGSYKQAVTWFYEYDKILKNEA